MACHVQAGGASLEWFVAGLMTGQSADVSSLHLRCFFGNTLDTLAAAGVSRGVLGQAWLGLE